MNLHISGRHGKTWLVVNNFPSSPPRFENLFENQDPATGAPYRELQNWDESAQCRNERTLLDEYGQSSLLLNRDLKITTRRLIACKGDVQVRCGSFWSLRVIGSYGGRCSYRTFNEIVLEDADVCRGHQYNVLSTCKYMFSGNYLLYNKHISKCILRWD